jgi:N-acetylglucosaminyldiphosphoundecaprenol N-acetyl-beta-D-mannosaminyltransferase
MRDVEDRSAAFAAAGVEIYRVFDIPIAVADQETIVGNIVRLVREARAALVATVNVEFLLAARRNEAFREVLQNNAFNVADSVGVAWAIRWRLGIEVPIFPGVELVEAVVRSSVLHRIRVGFLGGSPDSASVARKRLLLKYPDADIWVGPEIDVGDHLEFDRSVLHIIRAAKVDVLFVCLGTPKQELWLWENLSATGVRVGVGVGGSFDILSGKIARAPNWMRMHGLEWVYRVSREPRRLRRLAGFPLFILRVLLKRQVVIQERLWVAHS